MIQQQIEVEEIWRLNQREIAKIFGVSRSTITLIHSRKTWKHVNG